eukprot:CAMPEP_0184693936 /NCGR_PEP_ID=MMETSP0313-20130426/2029_1 /TAXON_ID=2792 /ORGANISM="Porphyridium aerugineum, Strain SAG 1380-2" /LENGTH=228 /DNA_ID=CAMNT_0027152115 /DNA_START=118 /DNA_END=804 /DNA_ORIENTATION=-
MTAAPVSRLAAKPVIVSKSNRSVLTMNAGSAPEPVDKAKIMELLQSSQGGDRARGVNLARYLPENECLEALFSVVSDPNPQIRYAAVSQLAVAGKVDANKTFEIMKKIVAEDKEPTVQAAAADVIAMLQLPGSYELLEQLYKSTTDWMLRFSILSGFGEMGDARAYDLLMDALKNAAADEPLIRLGALGSLGELGDKRAISEVEKYVNDKDTSIAERAKIALEMLKSK